MNYNKPTDKMCTHEMKLSYNDYEAAGKPWPPPTMMYTCECGGSLMCKLCGWQEANGACHCNKILPKLYDVWGSSFPYAISGTYLGASGLTIDLPEKLRNAYDNKRSNNNCRNCGPLSTD